MHVNVNGKQSRLQTLGTRTQCEYVERGLGTPVEDLPIVTPATVNARVDRMARTGIL